MPNNSTTFHALPRQNLEAENGIIGFYSRNPIAMKLLKKICGRSILDLHALKAYVDQATLQQQR